MNQSEKLRALAELKDPTLRIQRFLTERAEAEAILKMDIVKGEKGDNGEDGYTPIKGKDYFTNEEIKGIIDYVQSNVKDGESIQGEKGDNGETPFKGIDYWTKEDQDKIIKDILKQIPKVKDGISPKIEDVVSLVTKELKLPNTGELVSKGELVEFLKRGGYRGGGASFLSQLQDVSVGSQINGQVLSWNATTGKWTPTTSGGGSGTVTDVAAITLGTTGTDLSSTVATGTTTPVITLQVPTASAANRGVLSAADWSTFNNKGNVSKVGTPVDNQVGVWTGDGTIEGNVDFTFDGTRLSVAEISVGNVGTEGSGINIGGVTYESTAKVSDIDGTNYAQTILHRHSTTLEPLILGARSNSNTSSHADVTAGQSVFSIFGAGWLTSNYKLFGAFKIVASALGSLSGTSSPGKIIFQTTPNASVTPTDHMVLDSDKSTTFLGTVLGNTDNTYDLGTTAKKWANLFVTTIGATATRVTNGWFTTTNTNNLKIDGTAGAGYITLVGQASNPTAPAAGTLLIHCLTVNGFTRMEQDNEATTNLIYGRDNVFIAKNTSGGTIAKGSVVYVTGSTGNVPNISKAQANSGTTLPSVAVVVDDIPNNAFSQVMTVGIISGFDTSAFSSGDSLYVSTTVAGGLTSTRPSGTTNFVQRVGSVLVSGVGNGSLMVNIAPAILNTETGTNAATWTGSAIVGTTFNGNTLTTGSSTYTGTAAATYTFPTSSKTIAANDGSNMTLASQAIGDIITASSTTALNRLADVATGQVLVSGGVGVAPAYSANPAVTTLELGHATDTTLSRAAAGILAVEGELLNGYATTATAAGTTTLSITDKIVQFFTGTTTQTVKLPTTSVVAGQRYVISNTSTGLVSVQSSGANAIVALGLNQTAIFTALVSTPTTAANWVYAKSNLAGNANGKRILVVTQAATPAMDTDNGDIMQITGIAQAITSMTTNLTGTPSEGDIIEIQFTDNATARAITWGASFANGGLVNLPTTTVLSVMLRVVLQRTGSVWSCVGTA